MQYQPDPARQQAHAPAPPPVASSSQPHPAHPQQQGQQGQQQGQAQQQQQAYGRGTVPSFIAQNQRSYEQQHHQHQQRLAQEHEHRLHQQHLHQQQRDLALFGNKPPQAPPTDQYVYFDRRPHFRKDTLEKAQAAKLKLEHYYQKQVHDAIERNTRRTDLEKRLAQDHALPDDRKHRQLQQLGRTESSFLRLRRTRLGLDDFRTVKVIGKGAFGE
ncbi:uncharacterized protein JCM10292_003879, partial [Rhodotorula paludigena]|uniref:uncharacterized protein n=1 Tax=Rhodotorula paludigena TaxID=86838 RepID=UPI003180D4EE